MEQNWLKYGMGWIGWGGGGDVVIYEIDSMGRTTTGRDDDGVGEIEKDSGWLHDYSLRVR